MVKQWKRSLSGADVQAEAEDALEKDIGNMSPDSNSVAANLDGGVAAVDWSSKTPKTVDGSTNSNNQTVVSVTGSGYITGIIAHINSTKGSAQIGLNIDGNTIFSDKNLGGGFYGWETGVDKVYKSSPLFRFNSSFELTSGTVDDFTYYLGEYVLD